MTGRMHRCGDIMVILDGNERIVWKTSSERIPMPTAIWPGPEQYEHVHRHLLTKHALRSMMRARQGRIIYVSSVVAHTGNPGQAAYAASKSGLTGLSQTVAQEYAAYNIKTAVVAPGLLDTGMSTDIPDRYRTPIADRSLSVSEESGQRTADVIAFLSSSAADHINATQLNVEGGVKYP